MKKEIKGFTLAEVLITLTVLGVVAAITVPSIVHNNQTRVNKTKLKKAMAAYDNAISQMSIFSRIKTKNEFKNWAEKTNGTKDCANARSFFKVVENTGDVGCKFKTSDGVWWDISNIDRTIVSFKEANLKEEKAKDFDDREAFILVTSFDSSNETLRVDDLGYETSNPVDYSNVFVAKLYNFISGTESDISKFDVCKAKGADTCVISVDGRDYTYLKMSLTDYSSCNLKIYDSSSYVSDYCSESKAHDVYALIYKNSDDKELGIFDDSGSVCTSSACKNNGDYKQAAINRCASQNTRMANIAELVSLQQQHKLIGVWYMSYEDDYKDNSFLVYGGSGTISGYGYKHAYRNFVCIDD